MALTDTLGGRSLGMLLLGAWLILNGVLALLQVRVTTMLTMIMAVIALFAGILIILRR